MNRKLKLSANIVASLAMFVGTAVAQTPVPGAATWDSVGRVLQTSPTPSPGYTRYNLPRRDIALRIRDVTVAPALALGAWAGFSGSPTDATVMGDLVLLSPELAPVQAELARQHIAVTAIHNHLSGESPQITYLHYHGRGPAMVLAARLDTVLSRTAIPRPVPSPPAQPLAIDSGLVFRTLGASGRAQGSVAQLSVMLVPGVVTMDGRPVVPAMGYASPINVQMVDSSRAVATGDFTVVAGRVEPVTRALAQHGIPATAVHSHLVGAEPTLYYIHFWADGPLGDVLRGLRAAIDAGR